MWIKWIDHFQANWCFGIYPLYPVELNQISEVFGFTPVGLAASSTSSEPLWSGRLRCLNLTI